MHAHVPKYFRILTRNYLFTGSHGKVEHICGFNLGWILKDKQNTTYRLIKNPEMYLFLSGALSPFHLEVSTEI